MKKRLMASLAVICAATVMCVAGVQAAGGAEYKPKVPKKALFDGSLEGLPGKRVIVKAFTFKPGFKTAWHYHPAHVFVYVIEGELTVDVTGEPRKTVRAGELYREAVGKVMSGGNISTKPTRVVVFQIGDADKPMMIKANPK